MGILKKLDLRNFECFRENVIVRFDDATFLIGENNSGKSSLFRAISLFFGDIKFSRKYLNKSLYRSRRTGYNVLEIIIAFDLDFVHTTALKGRLFAENSNSSLLEIKRKFTLSDAGNLKDEFEIHGVLYNYESLPKDYQTLIESIKLNYIHPQQGEELLKRAQAKLRNRLLDNWGRSNTMTREMNNLEEGWKNYRIMANEYLSQLLTQNIKDFWGSGEVKINLPKSIKEIIDIGEIQFQMNDALPEISLTSQGTGVQQSLLYYASYVLDRDKTLSRNKEYHPVWLLEEPESFLHAELIVRLAKDLTSASWLENLQLLATTHSGLLLASSLKNQGNILWNLLKTHKLEKSFNPSVLDYKDVDLIGKIMGDPNFDTYFYASLSKIFVEDSSNIFVNKLVEGGINAYGIGGISELKRHIRAIDAINSVSLGKIMRATFIVDGDKGKNQIKEFLSLDNRLDEKEGFEKYCLSNGIVIIIFPEDYVAEDLFLEFEEYINNQMHMLCGENLKLKDPCPSHLTTAHTKLKHRYLNNPIDNWNIVEQIIKKDDDVKHQFWKEVSMNNYLPDQTKMDILKELLQD